MVRSWTVTDFLLVWLAGFVGSGVFVAIGALITEGDFVFVLGLLGTYVGNLGVLVLLRARKDEADLGLVVEPKDVGYAGLGILLQIVLAVLVLPLARLLFPDGEPPQLLSEALSDPEASTLLRLGIFVTAVTLTPFTEELLFRGVLLRAVAHRGRRFTLLVTALVFAVVHVVGLDPERLWASAAVVLPPLFVFGLIQAWLTLRHRRLGPAMFLHSGWNLLVTGVLLIPNELLETLA